MSDTTDVTSDVSSVQASEEAAGSTRRRRPGSGLAAMLLPELQGMASSLGISGTGRMRKGEHSPPRNSLCVARRRLGVAPLLCLFGEVVKPLASPTTPGAFYKGLPKIEDVVPKYAGR